MDEKYPFSASHPDQDDEAFNQALLHVGTVAFDLDLAAGVKEIEENSAAEQKKYDEAKIKDSKELISGLNELIRNSLFNQIQFTTVFNFPEQWLQYRRFFTSVIPDDSSNSYKYGLLVGKTDFNIKKSRHPFSAVILAQNPFLHEGTEWQDTIAIVDSNSGLASQNDQGVITSLQNSDCYLKEGYESYLQNDIHLVRFNTRNVAYSDIRVPGKDEIAAAYSTKDKTFTFNQNDFAAFNQPEKIYRIQRIDRLSPATLRVFPDFFSNLLAFLSNCPNFDIQRAEYSLETISTIIEKYNDDPLE